tara:strand:+ start:234 stop:452 length:219 start_codon:yes stop_codon:yes gene_type:complete
MADVLYRSEEATLSIHLVIRFLLPVLIKTISTLLCLVMAGAVLMELKIREDKLIKALTSYDIIFCSFFLLIE